MPFLFIRSYDLRAKHAKDFKFAKTFLYIYYPFIANLFT